MVYNYSYSLFIKEFLIINVCMHVLYISHEAF